MAAFYLYKSSFLLTFSNSSFDIFFSYFSDQAFVMPAVANKLATAAIYAAKPSKDVAIV